MKRLIQPLTPLLGLAALVLLQQGCAVDFEVVSTPSDPYPNATHIEHRVKTQVYRVTSAFNAGNLGQDMADGLAENDEMVRSMAYQDREPSQQTQDLDPDQNRLFGFPLERQFTGHRRCRPTPPAMGPGFPGKLEL